MAPLGRALPLVVIVAAFPAAAAAQQATAPPNPRAATGASAARQPPARSRAAHAASAAAQTLMPGFETRPDGSTRLFVELTQPVAYEAKPGRSTITYVLRGARVDRRNDQNPLVTQCFNTPVTSARLVPHGRDVWFVVDLRAGVQPTTTMDAGKNGAAVLSLAFPKGDYLGARPAAPANEATAAVSASR